MAADVKMEPPMWWTGMESHQLQIMVNGENIRDAVPSIDYDGVTIDSVARLDSPNYQFIYLTIDDGTKPGKMDIEFKSGESVLKTQYELLQRDSSSDSYVGFDSSDALYLIMRAHILNPFFLLRVLRFPLPLLFCLLLTSYIS